MKKKKIKQIKIFKKIFSSVRFHKSKTEKLQPNQTSLVKNKPNQTKF
jgi:hypothetical protein